MRRDFLKQIININLISRFFAKQIDLVLVHLAAFVFYAINLKYSLINIHPLLIYMISLLLWTLLEGVMVFYFNTTLGKFSLGLRIYPETLRKSMQRSWDCYIKGLGLGLPLVGWFLSGYYYLKGLKEPIPWDKYAPVHQSQKHFLQGMITLMGVGLIIIISSLIIHLNFKQNPPEVNSSPSEIVETVTVDYPNMDSEGVSGQLIEEETEELWLRACQLGAVGFLNHQGVEEFNIELITETCYVGSSKYLDIQEEPSILYLKACSFGIGIGSSLLYKDLDLSPIKNNPEELLKVICLPDLAL